MNSTEVQNTNTLRKVRLLSACSLVAFGAACSGGVVGHIAATPAHDGTNQTVDGRHAVRSTGGFSLGPSFDSVSGLAAGGRVSTASVAEAGVTSSSIPEPEITTSSVVTTTTSSTLVPHTPGGLGWSQNIPVDLNSGVSGGPRPTVPPQLIPIRRRFGR